MHTCYRFAPISSRSVGSRFQAFIASTHNTYTRSSPRLFSRLHSSSSSDVNEQDLSQYDMDADMKARIMQAKGWESMKLSDQEVKEINELIGLDDEILDDSEPINKRNTKKMKSNVKGKGMTDAALADASFDARIRGFLELNPHICSGCGASFQTKAENNPGYLTPEKFQQHKQNSVNIREVQNAIKVLHEASIELDSPMAEDLLRQAKVSSNVIEGVRSFGQQYNSTKIKKTDVKPHTLSAKLAFNVTKYEVDGISLINDINHEANPEPKRTTIKLSDFRPTRRREKIFQKPELKPTGMEIPPSLMDQICVCQRCYKLTQYGKVDNSLRPGWSSHELLTPERFELLLGEIKKNPAVVLCLVDLFDLHGSLLPNLREIAGNNPIVIAANKFDLLPPDTSELRLKNWMISEIKEYCNLQGPREKESDAPVSKKNISEDAALGILRSENVHLISCQTGKNMDALLSTVMKLAEIRGKKVYVMGAANVGKSSFINRLLEGVDKPSKVKSNRGSSAPHPTVSNLPGTTLDFLKIRLPNGVTIVDTPGLINKGQLTSKLTVDELKQVIPKKPINVVTLRLTEGKSVLIGGLGLIELFDSRPFFLSFFISNEIKLHPTDSTKADEFLLKHIGSLVFPPVSQERLKELGPYESREFRVKGDSWNTGSTDIVIAGLGWIMVTGPGIANIRLTVPSGTSVGLRPALLPFEAKFTTAKFTGGKLLKKSGRPNISGYGWRS